MEENKDVTGKLSYEQLEVLAHQMSQKLKDAQSTIKNCFDQSLIKRVELLMEIIKIGKFPEDFTNKCMEEIIELMTIPEEANIVEGDLKDE